MNILQTEGKPLWKKVYEDLNRKIGNYNFGQRFYTSGEICRDYKVSQITAVRALSELQKEGQVEKIQKKGTVVRNVRKKNKHHVDIARGVTFR